MDASIGRTRPDPHNIFLHFVDHEFLDLKGLAIRPSSELLDLMKGSMAVAALITGGKVYMPAAAYFESYYARRLFDMFPALREYGILGLVGNATGISDFVEGKQSQYAREMQRYPLYFKGAKHSPPSHFIQ